MQRILFIQINVVEFFKYSFFLYKQNFVFHITEVHKCRLYYNLKLCITLNDFLMVIVNYIFKDIRSVCCNMKSVLCNLVRVDIYHLYSVCH